ncbi:MAG TPA: proline dehydrogenase family protein [Gaiellaceae bacterium]|nr:proline dehydrogenase family protein [Gaiellaceae bacterium]
MEAVDALLRKGILVAADDPRVRRVVSRHGMRLGGSRFVAGETVDECVRVLRSLNERGLHANTTLLGEGVRDEAAARAVTDTYVALVDRLVDEQLRANVALKLTHLGLELGEEVAYANVRRAVERAQERDTFIRIDMEQSSFVDATLRTYRRLRDEGFTAVGTVLQAYLHRTEQDLEQLLPLQPNLRLVKGAYLEPPEVAYPRKADVDAAYVRLLETMLRGGGHTAIATHDESIIEHAIRFADRHAVPRESFEFQMLYGVRPQLQLELAARGYKVLVATPYGPEWYPYLMRRLGERPANALFLLRNLAKR